MSARSVLILALLFIGIAFYGGGYAGYCHYRKNAGEWKSEIEKLREMSWLELIIKGGVLVAAVGSISFFIRGGDSFISVLSLILVILVMALYIVARRGGSIAALMFVILSALYFFLIGMFIGIPQKAPIFTINKTEITLACTTAADLIEHGFDIYVEQKHVPGLDYQEILSSGSFKKYPVDRSVYVKKGFQINYAPYLLVKDDVVIGYIGFYGDENKDIVLEDCKIIRIVLNEDSVRTIRENSVSCKLNGFDLLSPLKPEKVKKTFGSKLWLIFDNPTDRTEMQYGIHWSAAGHAVDNLFWNRYYSFINFDETNTMVKFELSTNVARDRSFL